MAGGTTLHCAGLPLAGERPLTPPERERVASWRRAHGVRALSRAALLPIAAGAAVAAVAAAVAAEAAGGRAAQLLAAAAIVALGVVVPLAGAVGAARAGVTWLALGRDLDGGAALRFARGERSVVVLPHARLALEWDGAPAAPGPRLEVGEVAEAPATAATYAVDVGTAAAAPGLAIVRRPLSPAERDEIATHAQRLGRVPAVLVGFTVAFVLLSREVLGGGAPVGGAEAVLVAVWASALAYAWWRFVRARALARKLREDGSNGWALRATSGDPAGNEVLAVSGVTWTIQGSPAPWRAGRAVRSP